MKTQKRKRRIINNKWTKINKSLKELLDIIRCAKCKNKLYEPHQFLSCGHFSCISCIQNKIDTCNECHLIHIKDDIIKEELIDKIVKVCCKVVEEFDHKKKTEVIDIQTEIPVLEIVENSIEEKVITLPLSNEITKSSKFLQKCPSKLLLKRKINNIHSNKNTKKIKVKEQSLPKFTIPKNINKKNHHGETKLQQECKKGHKENVKCLLEAGADPNICCAAKWTPLQESVDYGYYDIVKILLKANADVNKQGHEDKTALHEAAKNNNLKMVKLLLNYGASKNVYDVNGKKPIDYSTSTEVKKLLMHDRKNSGVGQKRTNFNSRSNLRKSHFHEKSESEESDKNSYVQSFERNSQNITINHTQKFNKTSSQIINTWPDVHKSSNSYEFHFTDTEEIDVVN